MDARPDAIAEFFNAERQLLVPLFQRPYEWGERNWSTLWDDLVERYEQRAEATNVPHFTGAIVTSPAKSIPVGVSKFLVIDGQQRLTTIALILCAIRSVLPPDSVDRKRIARLLINDLGEGTDRYKLLPTQPDREAWASIVDETALEGDSQFHLALRFFQKKLQGKDSDDKPYELTALLEALRTKLHAVSITLGDADDPYLIFESLNAKGAPLTQADLIRNYILLRLRTQEQEKIYRTFWLPMQERLGESLTEFMRVFLMQSGSDIVKGDIYAALKRRMSTIADGMVAEEIAELDSASVEYSKFLSPVLESRERLRRRLVTLQRWEAATSHPFLLQCFRANRAGSLTLEELEEILGIVESFVIRRAICRVPTNQLKKIFLALVREVKSAGTAQAVRASLMGGTLGGRWPRDAELVENWRTYPIYASSNLARCRVILEALEAASQHKELASFDHATVEHVMPQTLTDDWKAELGPDADDVYSRYVDTVGNLTLSGYNASLSNSSFEEKKVLFATSNFTMNRYFLDLPRWNEAAMVARADHLVKTAIALWPRPEA
jgi:hypothetical protein